ncbi:RAVE subunit 2/Rogdi [Halteromyces radiatus]|uniref:RAVE subunit 2/Rogdi n=1 Tax=Halteromyces radiatus TaxID=101107 RepID=UPI00221EFED1|nr:RAVE subunit 2/Rogdi [Halteromyces radiatus]KAI8099596.1 RAVE subunit 2/Rogdi [Halteromyces radiatus]
MHLQHEIVSVAEKERNWLLEILPGVLIKLKHHLDKSYSLLSTVNKADALPLSTTQNETIKGYINLSGCHLNKAEIQVRLANYHAEPIKATILPSSPYFLEQVQQCKNYIILANKHIQECHEPLSKPKAVAFLDAMCQLMDHALHALDYPNESMLFPGKVCHTNLFNPPLKNDLVIEFFINGVFIVCNVLAITHHSRNMKLDRQQHQYVTYKDKVTEILDEARTQTQSPMLTDLNSPRQQDPQS